MIHEYKELTPEEYLEMFPKIKLTEWTGKEFKKVTKLTRVIRIKGTKKFRPIFTNSVGAYYLKGNKEIYLKH